MLFEVVSSDSLMARMPDSAMSKLMSIPCSLRFGFTVEAGDGRGSDLADVRHLQHHAAIRDAHAVQACRDFDLRRRAVRGLGLDRIATWRQAERVRIDREGLRTGAKGAQLDGVLLA